MKLVEKTVVPEKNKLQGYQYSLSGCLNPKENGGEAILVTVDVFDNGDPPPHNLFFNTTFNLECYGNHTSSFFFGNETPFSLQKFFRAMCEEIEQNHRLKNVLLTGKGQVVPGYER